MHAVLAQDSPQASLVSQSLITDHRLPSAPKSLGVVALVVGLYAALLLVLLAIPQRERYSR